jgi:transcription antitermination factor NusG
MTLWAVAVRNGTEQNVQEQLEALGLEAIAPRRVDLIRQGKRRYPDPVTSAYLPGYVFAWFGDGDWHVIRHIKEVRTMMAVSPQSERLVRAFIDRVEADYAQRMAQIEAGERVSEYSPGDLLTIMTGQFAGQLATFARILQTAHDVFPEIEAEMDMMGQTVKLRLDPISVRRAAE